MNQLKCEHSFPVCIHCEERHKREVSRLQEELDKAYDYANRQDVRVTEEMKRAEAAEASLEMHKADNEICRSAMDNLANKLFAAEQEVKRLQEQYENRTPTEWAYEQACKALEIWHGEANRLKDELAKAMKVVEAARYVDDESGADGLWELSMALREFDSERG
jgi:chromosome segregation ATPase